MCLPAFRPDRCIREDDTERSENVSTKLQALHATPTPETAAPVLAPGEDAKPEVIYHMCVKSDWEAAKASGEAYYPPTFTEDVRCSSLAIAFRSRMLLDPTAVGVDANTSIHGMQ